MGQEIESDYVVVGAGAAGMAITDELLGHTDATITIVDRRHAPGGHWLSAYPYVRLHQPSRFYGVSSVPLGEDTLDTTGTNAGFYELAGADEIRAYYERVMHRHFLPSGRVRFIPNCDHVGDGRLVSRVGGGTWHVRARHKLVDTTYLEGQFPATTPPPFEIAQGVRCAPAGDVVRVAEAPDAYVVIGAGKTALDTIVWLLEHGVDPAAIQWIKPREAWWMNRAFQQPLSLFPEFYRGAALQIEAMAQAPSLGDLFEHLEHEGIFLRVDPRVTPTMFRGAIISESELHLLRQVENVVRLGRVRRIEPDHIVLDEGRVPTTERTLHIHCAATGLAYRPARPIFEPGRITVQPFAWGFACYQFATIGVVEATVASDDEKNRLCPAMTYWDRDEDYVKGFVAGMVGDRMRAQHAAVGAWMKTTRLNPTFGGAEHRDDPRVVDARERLKRHGAAAVVNATKLVGGAVDGGRRSTPPGA